jgi:3-deoxy-7-phosphoheptulonate synthase
MLVVMKAQATEEQVRLVCQKIEKLGYRAHAMPGAQRTAIGITGNKGEVEQGTLEEMAGVQEVIKVSKPYKLVSRDVKEENTVIRFAGTEATIGGSELAIMAGPCAIESREQAFADCRAGGIGRGRNFFGAERTSRGLLLIRFRGWARKRCGLWPRSGSSMG